MDFIEAPFGGEGVEVPLVTSTVIRPGDDICMWYHNQRPPVYYSARLDIFSFQGSIATFIQEWLYFGLLAVLCDTTITVYDFSTPGKRGSGVVSSELVKSKLINMQLSVLRLPETERADVLQRHGRILSDANEAVHWVESHFTLRSDLSDLIDLIVLSVKVLIGTISRSYDCAHTPDSRPQKAIGLDWFDVAHRQGNQLTAAGRAIEVKMIKNGWCVHQIHKVLSTFSYQTAYYFAKLPRPGSARLVHEICSTKSCRGWNSQPGHTSARHATDTCTCPTVSISSVDVAKVIQGGHIPLVSIEEDMHGSLSLRLHTKRWYSRYIAISHVWADGLGNTFENGLPTCQLRMLQTYFAQISRSQPTMSALTMSMSNTLFWMDTLCIPTQTSPPAIPIPEKVLEDVKGKAIDTMNVVYSTSSHTLVLDAEMRMIPMAADHATKLAYIQCCGWTTRSWTLQEGCLPPSTLYAFSDGIYAHETARLAVPLFTILLRRFCGSNPDFVAQQFDSSVQREIWTSLSIRHFSIWDPLKPDLPILKDLLVRDRFAGVWNELLDRVSSVPADTPAIFANLLGVSAYEVLKRRTEQQRVALIIRQQNVLPIELLYNTGPRLRERLSVHGSEFHARPQMLQRVTTHENTPEEWIGLLEMPELQTQSFKNGWVPASIRGDKCLQPLVAKYYLQVLEHCLQVHHNGIEAVPYMYTTVGPHIPLSTFVLDSQCSSVNSHVASRTSRTFIAIDRLVDDSTHSDEGLSKERILGHCFMYDPGLMLAMCHGRVDYAPGSHLLILRQSGGRITTRYSSPIQLSRWTEEAQVLKEIPMLECKCRCPCCPGIKDYVDILYDADDLGPLLTASLEPPELFIQKYWFNPVAVFAAHYSIWTALAPYVGEVRPRFIMATCVIMPLVVYLYQSVILQQAARRLFLEPLNDRGPPSSPYRFGTRNLRRRIDSAMVANWSVMLFGPALDGLFWLVLKGSEGKRSTVKYKFHLLATLAMVVQWYLVLGTRDPDVFLGRRTQRLKICIMILCLAGLSYDLYTDGLTLDVCSRYFELYLQIVIARPVMSFVLSITRLTLAEIRRWWEARKREMQQTIAQTVSSVERGMRI